MARIQATPTAYGCNTSKGEQFWISFPEFATFSVSPSWSVAHLKTEVIGANNVFELMWGVKPDSRPACILGLREFGNWEENRTPALLAYKGSLSTMGDWVIGAFINLCGSITINFGTNLLKLGHTERERCVLDNNGTNGKLIMKSIICFQTWRVGVLFFAFGNCLNFISFGYAAQSLLAALGSVQFVSNIAFAFFVLNKRVTVKVLVATAFIVLGNIFLVAFGNHQSPVYTPEQLAEKYSNTTFLLYCLSLILVVALHHSIYRRLLLAVLGQKLKSHWQMLLPYSYAIVSAAIGSCSVLFAKSLSNLLRLAMSSGYQLNTWFTYCILLLFLSTAGFWMARLNEGLALFDAILIIPIFQIAWTFFSICTGFVYFQEYLTLNTLRAAMFMLGMMSVFVGILLLAPEEPKGNQVMDSCSLHSITSSAIESDDDRLMMPSEMHKLMP
ncbi:hypothetical protein Nepgr_027488 [Nepenthes gracilis]|uniref:Probable magnesium transporter n=1 Tax=Nepenthes gracilis TaxID=150966 RepID=A0AAD3T9Y5_NEPGR|nr:hypothetical protein Nepgr_027488 [Nepenthes gracilis]